MTKKVNTNSKSKCIGSKCKSWWYCSKHNSRYGTRCTADLSTKFYLHYNDGEMPLPPDDYTYRDPFRKPGTRVVTKKKRHT